MFNILFSFRSVIMLVLAALLTLYMYWFVKRLVKSFQVELTRSIKIICFIAAVVISLPVTNFFSTYAMVVLQFAVFSAVIDFLLCVYRLIIRKKEEGKLFVLVKKLHYRAVISLLLTVSLLIYGYINIQSVRETNYQVSSDDIESPLRILLISDLHMGMTQDEESFTQLCAQMQKTNPDLIVLTGDIFDESTLRSEMEAACSIFGTMTSTYGTYYIFGNHDTGSYRGSQEFGSKEIEEAMAQNNISVLQDEVMPLTKGLQIAGRRDTRDDTRIDISTVLKDVAPKDYVILLDHHPVEFEEAKAAGADLQLSGHTHGGQIWPTGFTNKYNYGLYEIGDFKAIVTSGIGGWGYQIRTGYYCEYVSIDVQPENNNGK
jgi:predicted MPP superfamily phosphohydrolase